MVVASASAGGRGRWASAGGTALGDLEEDVGGEVGQALL